MDSEMLHKLAMPAGTFSYVDSVIDLCVSRLISMGHEVEQALRITSAVFTEITKADLRGLISVGDEHEWSTIAVRAGARARRLEDEAAGIPGELPDMREAAEPYDPNAPEAQG